jgi:hypothetical protein
MLENLDIVSYRYISGERRAIIHPVKLKITEILKSASLKSQTTPSVVALIIRRSFFAS